MNDNGYVLIARKIVESEIFLFKPAVWLKLWLHMIARVNWKDSSMFKRGSGFFKYEIAKGWFKEGELTPNIYKKALHFMREAKMIGTSRTPRGLKITILNYDLYQNTNNYGGTTEEHQRNNRGTSILEEEKKKRIYKGGEKYLETWNKTFKTSYKSTASLEKPLSFWLKEYKIEDICNAVKNIKHDDYWKDKDIDPIWLLRKKDSNGEVDRIAKMLNIKTGNIDYSRTDNVF